MKLPSCPRTLIINILRKHPDGLTLTSIAQLTGLHRHTATKYVYELKGAGIINERDVGSAKLCYLKEGLNKSEEKAVIKRLNGGRKSVTGQTQIFMAFLFLFLIPTTAFVAHNISQVITAEGVSIPEELNISEVIAEADPETIRPFLKIPQEINTTPTKEPSKQNETISEENIPAEDQTVAKENETNVSFPAEEDMTPENRTYSVEEKHNETVLPDEGIFGNETSENQMHENLTEHEPEQPEVETPKPVLEAKILSPDRITRGEIFEISGIVKNSGKGEANNTRLLWEIPSGFGIVSGETEKNCGILPPDSECSGNLTISSSLSTDTGRAEFRIMVKYEK